MDDFFFFFLSLSSAHLQGHIGASYRIKQAFHHLFILVALSHAFSKHSILQSLIKLELKSPMLFIKRPWHTHQLRYTTVTLALTSACTYQTQGSPYRAASPLVSHPVTDHITLQASKGSSYNATYLPHRPLIYHSHEKQVSDQPDSTHDCHFESHRMHVVLDLSLRWS